MEAQLQEVLQIHSGEDEVEEKLHRLTVETSDLKVQLAEAEGEKLEAVRRLEAVQREKREMEQWIAELEKKGIAPVSLFCAVLLQLYTYCDFANIHVHVLSMTFTSWHVCEHFLQGDQSIALACLQIRSYVHLPSLQDNDRNLADVSLLIRTLFGAPRCPD